MGATVAGILVLAVFFSGAFMVSRTTLLGNVLMGDTMKESIRVSGEKARTEIQITSAMVGAASCDLTVNVDNTGATSVANLSIMDVIVQFPGGDNAPQRLVYAGSGPPNLAQWAVSSISGQFEPSNFNPGESITIDAKLTLTETGDGTVTVGTHNGVVDTALFPALSPCI